MPEVVCALSMGRNSEFFTDDENGIGNHEKLGWNKNRTIRKT
jgi:hypothetical protein